MKWTLEGRTALITGAARGLGAGLAPRLVEAGMNVVLTGLEPEALAAVAAPLGERALVVEADVTSLAQMHSAVTQGTAHFGGIDVVVANAGINAMAPLAEVDPAQFRQVIEVNLMGVFNTLHASAGAVFAREGYFLVVSSMAAAIHSPLQSHYCAAKAGIAAMASSFRLEAKVNGADVGVIHPTFAATDMMTFTHKAPGGKEIWGGNKGLWKMVTPEEVIAAMEKAIHKRSRTRTVPGSLAAILRAPGFVQPLLEKSFSMERIQSMLSAFRAGRDKPQQTSQSEGEQSV